MVALTMPRSTILLLLFLSAEATLNKTSDYFTGNELFRSVYFNENGEPKKASLAMGHV